jgi:hypothetical protein
MVVQSGEASASRQHRHSSFSPSSSTTSRLPTNSNISTKLSPQPAATAKLQHHFFDATLSPEDTSGLVYNTSDLDINDYSILMPSSYDFNNSSSQSNHFSFPVSDAPDTLQMWALGGGNTVANPNGIMTRAHNRAPSSSSIGSTASISAASPFHGPQSRGRVQEQPAKGRRYRDQSSRSHLPTPSVTPVRSQFSFNQSQDLNSAVAASLAMGHALQEPNRYPEDEIPPMSHSQRHSFSSLGRDPATPMNMEHHDHDSQQTMPNGEKDPLDVLSWLTGGADVETDPMANVMVVPKLHRTVTDAMNDELFSPHFASMSQPPQVNTSYLMPTGNRMVNERLLEAQMARSASSGSNRSGGARSPFRTPYGHVDGTDAHDTKYDMSPNTESEPKTISPKDAMLPYTASANDYPLFPQPSTNTPTSYSQTVAPAANRQNLYRQPNMGYGNLEASQPGWVTGLAQATMTSAPVQSYNGFAAPALPSHMSLSGVPQAFLGGAPLQQHHPRRSAGRQTDRNPEFPAQLTSMESSASEAAPPSSVASSSMMINSPKPDSSADTGTYSCTYHGCLQRFTTPQKLQKHKRDLHRNNPNVTPGVGSGMSTSELMERNSQSGPHKCERINPTTGKSCNAIFSRPYDLTRHEDTIHNIRKQKVRCAICTEEKTFSRADALTRHMRVVHPEVDFPGKHTTRRKGSRGE